MTFLEQQSELYSRGTDYLSETAAGIARAKRWLNLGYREILNLYEWPFLLDSATGNGTVALTDLRRITYVKRSDGTPLDFATVEEIATQLGNLTDTGTPVVYYLQSVAGGIVNVIAWPLDPGEALEVGYVNRPPQMVADADEPIFAADYHNIIVDKAMVRAYLDTDNFEAARSLTEHINIALQSMAEDYNVQKISPSFIRYTE